MISDLLASIEQVIPEKLNFGQVPNEPDNVLVANAFGGSSPTMSIGQRQPLFREPSVQLIIRDMNYNQALNRLDTALYKLLNLSGPINEGATIIHVTQSSDIMPIGRDKKNRYMFSVNVIVKIQNIGGK